MTEVLQMNELKKEVTVTDGGFAGQLSRHVEQSVDGDPLWSARFLATNPSAVIQTHLDFLKVGAEIISTDSYQASVNGFMEHLGLNEEDSLKLISKSVELAKEARDKFLIDSNKNDLNVAQKPLIAGSVGPYGACLHDCSEYSGSYGDSVSISFLMDWHRPRLFELVNAGVDLIAMETIPLLKEGEALAELLKEFPTVQGWLSFSSQDGVNTSHGENLVHSVRQCWKTNPLQLIAVGVNCISPANVKIFLDNVKTNWKDRTIPLIVYPNSGEKYDAETKSWLIGDKKIHPIETYIEEWLSLGVSYIGGCCRNYAEDVKKIREEVNKWNRKTCDIK